MGRFWLDHRLSAALVVFAVVALLAPAHAMDPMHDVRYNLIPEILTPEQSEFSGGFQTHWVADGDFVGAFKFGINNRFEVGSKFTWETRNRFEDMYALLDLGTKFAIDPVSAVQADFLLGINNSRGGGMVFTYSKGDTYSKRFSSVYEARLGFLNAIAGDNWSIIELGAHPQFRIVDPVALRIGLVMSTSLRHPVDRFEIDLIPGFKAGVAAHLQVLADCAVGIVGSTDIRIGIHLISLF